MQLSAAHNVGCCRHSLRGTAGAGLRARRQRSQSELGHDHDCDPDRVDVGVNVIDPVNIAVAREASMERIVPITVLAGHLGAGKTTLLSRLASESTERTAFVVNAFDEVGLDSHFFTTDAEVVQTNNGSLCRGVRADLIAAIRALLARSSPPERIVVEASGLADPAAMIRSFRADETIREATRLDAIVTIVDLRHIIGHWNTREA